MSESGASASVSTFHLSTASSDADMKAVDSNAERELEEMLTALNQVNNRSRSADKAELQ